MARKSLFLFPCLLAAWTSVSLAASDCKPGVYVHDAAKAVLYERKDENGGAELRYQLVDGRRGTLGSGDQILRCRDGRLRESERGEASPNEASSNSTHSWKRTRASRAAHCSCPAD